MSAFRLLFWADTHYDIDPDKQWLCLRESYFDFLRANGFSTMGAMKQLMEDARTVNYR